MDLIALKYESQVSPNNPEMSGCLFHMFPHVSDTPAVTGEAGVDQMATTADEGLAEARSRSHRHEIIHLFWFNFGDLKELRCESGY